MKLVYQPQCKEKQEQELLQEQKNYKTYQMLRDQLW